MISINTRREDDGYSDNNLLEDWLIRVVARYKERVEPV
jgi:hypothetical protein